MLSKTSEYWGLDNVKKLNNDPALTKARPIFIVSLSNVETLFIVLLLPKTKIIKADIDIAINILAIAFSIIIVFFFYKF